MDEVTVPEGNTTTVAGLVNEQLAEGGEQAPVVEAAPTYTVKVDGQELQVTQDELLNGYQRQAHFTQETQKLAAERQRLAQAEAVWSAIIDDPREAIEALQEHFAEQLSQGNQENLDPEEARIAALEAHMESQRERETIAAVDAQLNALESEFGAFDHTAVLQHAMDRRIGDLRTATEHYMATSAAATAAAQQAATDAAALAAKQGLPAVAGGSSAAGSTKAGGRSIERASDAIREALLEHGVDSFDNVTFS